AQVPVGESSVLRVQPVPVEGDPPGGAASERPRRYGDDWNINFLVSFFSSAALSEARPLWIKVGISVAAENLEIDGTGRAEIAVPLEGCSAPVLFSLRGLEVGPGRVMIDFAQGGRPAGSLDLNPRVAAAIDSECPPGDAARPAEVLILNL